VAEIAWRRIRPAGITCVVPDGAVALDVPLTVPLPGPYVKTPVVTLFEPASVCAGAVFWASVTGPLVAATDGGGAI
jgi:hypothetical protein